MPVLAYCVVDARTPIDPPSTGIGGVPIGILEECELRCFFSYVNDVNLGSEAMAKNAALQFHAVLRAIFEKTAIIPFRFPTVVRDETELSDYLREHCAQHRKALSRLRDLVQMELHISLQGTREQARSTSGGEYLRSRQAKLQELQDAIHSARAAISPLLVDWRVRRKVGTVRCYALVPRVAISEFQRLLHSVALAGFSLRVTGPWPATEFLNDQHE